MIGENVFTGEFKHSVDPKNRMFFPASLRDELEGDIIITKGVDSCIAVYPMDAWDSFTEKLNALPAIQARKVKRFIYSSSSKTKLDSQGRVLIPQTLKEYAGIDKNVYVVGVGDHAEIWDEDKWLSENDMNSETLVDTLVELGF